MNHKYRVWDKVNKEWLTGSEALDVYWINNELKVQVGIEFADGRSQDEFEIVKYTGLKDRNNKEIYEGDIVRHISAHNSKRIEIVGHVRYERQCCAYWIVYTEYNIHSKRVIHKYKNLNADYGDDNDNYINLSIDVIGNIFYNPELISNKIYAK